MKPCDNCQNKPGCSIFFMAIAAIDYPATKCTGYQPITNINNFPNAERQTILDRLNNEQ